MNMTRREFVKAVAAASLLPVVSGSPSFTVHRKNMFPHDATSAETLDRCNNLLATDSTCPLALCHRGQVSPFVRAEALAEADLTKAIRLEPDNLALYYVRGVTLNRAENLRHAIGLLTAGGDIDGMAICDSTPDSYCWHGTDQGELLYMTFRDLGGVLEGEGRIDEALVAFQLASSFRAISQADLERWCEADMQVGRLCEVVIGYRSLLVIEKKGQYRRGLEEAERWLRSGT